MDGYVREKLVYRSSPGVRVPAYLLIPDGAGSGKRRPGILAAHGHGGGKSNVCGIRPARRGDAAWVDQLRYDYAVQAVRHGYIVIAPDWLPFGERSVPAWWCRPGRDPCNIANLAFKYFGRILLTQNIWDGMRAVDLLARHPQVDARRLGVIGLSYGGTMATHLLANDARLRAGVVSGYISTVRGDALGRRGKGNTCGAQAVPDLLSHGDIPEILGLACPKPVLCEMGKKETCFHYPDMQRAYARVRAIYRAARVPEHLAVDAFSDDHRWSGRRAWDWLARHL